MGKKDIDPRAKLTGMYNVGKRDGDAQVSAEVVPEQAQTATRKKKAVLSVRIDTETLNAFKAYADAVGVSMPVLLTASVNEYMTKHPLTTAQLSAWQARKKLEGK